MIGKAPPTKMCEDGSDWGERSIEIYDIVDKVGEGTYGEVFKAVYRNSMETDTQEQFALKKVRRKIQSSFKRTSLLIDLCTL